MDIEFVAWEAAQLQELAALAATAPDPWQAADVEAELRGGKPGFVAVLRGEVVGFAAFRVQGEEAELALLVVQDALRGRGIGERLLAHSLAALAADGLKSVLLEVRCQNRAAVSLYEKLGFVRLAKRARLYSRPPDDGYTMQKELAPGSG